MRNSSDNIKDRRNAILAILRKEKSVSINYLSDRFNISPLTMRRDLEYLENQGMIERFYGGAKIREALLETPYFDEKLASHQDEKILIAEYVASVLPPKTAIFMNGGTTTLEIMRKIRNTGSIIITNNVMAFNAAKNGNCSLLCSGGEYNSISRTYSGVLATNIIEKTNARYCILGVNGIDGKRGVTSAVYEETIINSLMAERCSGPVIVVADSSKIGKTTSFASLDLSRISELVTVSTADSRQLDQIAARGVKITLADQLKLPLDETGK